MTRGDGRSIQQGMARAQQQRERWTSTLAAGETTFTELVRVSRSDDYKALGRLLLLDLLWARPGWSELTAREALSHAGFDHKDTVQSIRRSGKKVDMFDRILRANPGQWAARPSFPKGWPWQGKLSLLVEDCGAAVPGELSPSGVDDPSQPGDGQQDEDRVHDYLASLISSPDEGG